MRLKQAIGDLALATAASYVGTKAMEPVSTWLYDHQSPADRAREDAARPRMPYRIAAEKITQAIGVSLSDADLDRLSLGFHYGLASPDTSMSSSASRSLASGLSATTLAIGSVTPK